ncbi:MAG: hypothetical protein DWI68_03310 [Chloroflexi bacterium]|nr:MAG: hypothetical protein DWI68_03310 [Chloroflexota bacterium]
MIFFKLLAAACCNGSGSAKISTAQVLSQSDYIWHATACSWRTRIKSGPHVFLVRPLLFFSPAAADC